MIEKMAQCKDRLFFLVLGFQFALFAISFAQGDNSLEKQTKEMKVDEGLTQLLAEVSFCSFPFELPSKPVKIYRIDESVSIPEEIAESPDSITRQILNTYLIFPSPFEDEKIDQLMRINFYTAFELPDQQVGFIYSGLFGSMFWHYYLAIFDRVTGNRLNFRYIGSKGDPVDSNDIKILIVSSLKIKITDYQAAWAADEKNRTYKKIDTRMLRIKKNAQLRMPKRKKIKVNG